MGLNHLAGSSATLGRAREARSEAVESVHTARDTKTIPWCRIRNVGTPTGCADSAGGAFIAGTTSLTTAGADGLVNTADDGAVEDAISPGDDKVLGTADDKKVPMTTYTRQIEITEVLLPNGYPNPNLRRLKVTIGYRVGTLVRTYTLTTYISAIS